MHVLNLNTILSTNISYLKNSELDVEFTAKKLLFLIFHGVSNEIPCIITASLNSVVVQ